MRHSDAWQRVFSMDIRDMGNVHDIRDLRDRIAQAV